MTSHPALWCSICYKSWITGDMSFQHSWWSVEFVALTTVWHSFKTYLIECWVINMIVKCIQFLSLQWIIQFTKCTHYNIIDFLWQSKLSQQIISHHRKEFVTIQNPHSTDTKKMSHILYYDNLMYNHYKKNFVTVGGFQWDCMFKRNIFLWQYQ